MPKSEPQPPLTKKRFEKLLTKAAQPVSEWQPDSAGKETSGSHPSDGCIGKRKRQGRTVDKEAKPSD